MKQLRRSSFGLLALAIILNLRAQPILVHPLDKDFGTTSFSNLRVGSQSADGAEAVLMVDFTYDGMSGPRALVLPVMTDKKQPKVSRWFGADPVSISSGRGTISLRVKFFNDEPGVPSELTTDHVNILMLTDGRNAKISEGRFAQTIKWGRPNATPANAPVAETPVHHSPPATAPFALSSTNKTKVANVDVVNRNFDRTEMTIAVEYQYAKGDGLPRMGIHIASTEEPGASAFFSSPLVDIARGNRRVVMFPVKLEAAAAQHFKGAKLATDQVWVYLTDATGAKSYIYQTNMVLDWRLPGGN